MPCDASKPRAEGRLVIAKALRLARKDLVLFARDRGALLACLGLPIVLVTIFGSAMGAMSGDGELEGVEFAVQDDDHSAASAALIAELERSQQLDVVREVDVEQRVSTGREPIGLVIPVGYAERLARGERSGLRLLRDPSKEIESQVATMILVPALFETAGAELGREVALRSLDLFRVPESMRPLVEGLIEQGVRGFEALAAEQTARAEDRGLDFAQFDVAREIGALLGVEVEDVVGDGGAGRRVAMQAHSVSGTAVMMLLFGLVGAGGSLLDERVEGTLDRLRLAPGSAHAILLGKYLATLVLGLAQLAILFAYGALVFDTPVLRAPVALFVVSLCVALASTSFGLLFAVLCNSRKQLEGLSTLVILTMSALGGSWFPLAFTPEWFQTLGHFTLNAWAMDAYQGLFWYGRNGWELWPELGVLLCIAASLCAFAAFFWNRRLQSA